jgi:exodeoxyribonuclease-3
VRIATFNVNSIKARLKFVLHWLEARQPDVACLQELKVTGEQFPHEAMKALGYHAYVHGQKQWNGVAVLSRAPAEVVQVGLPGAEALGARLLTVALGDLTVTSVYVPNGKTVEHDDFAGKLSFLEALAAHVSSDIATRAQAIVAGDFNIAPADVDSFDPVALRGAIFHTDAERSLLGRLFAAGLHDLYRERNPDGRMFSWWDYRAGCFHKNQGLRIDLVLATAAVLARTGEVAIDRDYRKKKDGELPSDHAPVMIELAA